MEHDTEVGVITTLTGYQIVKMIPADAGHVSGICKYKDVILLTTSRGHLYEWNEKELTRLA